jgi:hypothetical protein
MTILGDDITTKNLNSTPSPQIFLIVSAPDFLNAIFGRPITTFWGKKVNGNLKVSVTFKISPSQSSRSKGKKASYLRLGVLFD